MRPPAGSRLASEQCHAQAQRNLAVLYYDGKGVPEKDILQAYTWLTLAAGSQTAGDAADLRDDLTVKMTDAQIAEAEILARKYQEVCD